MIIPDDDVIEILSSDDESPTTSALSKPQSASPQKLLNSPPSTAKATLLEKKSSSQLGLKCPIHTCISSFFNLTQMVNHISLQHNRSFFLCSICQKAGTITCALVPSQLKPHAEVIHKGQAEFIECKMTTQRTLYETPPAAGTIRDKPSNNLVSIEHAKQSLIPCPVKTCSVVDGFLFNSIRLLVHIQTAHPRAIFECKICQPRSPATLQVSQLRPHVEIMHEGCMDSITEFSRIPDPSENVQPPLQHGHARKRSHAAASASNVLPRPTTSPQSKTQPVTSSKTVVGVRTLVNTPFSTSVACPVPYCSTVPTTYTHPQNLLDHLLNVHPNNQFVCYDCKAQRRTVKFLPVVQLKSHFEVIHNGVMGTIVQATSVGASKSSLSSSSKSIQSSAVSMGQSKSSVSTGSRRQSTASTGSTSTTEPLSTASPGLGLKSASVAIMDKRNVLSPCKSLSDQFRCIVSGCHSVLPTSKSLLTHIMEVHAGSTFLCRSCHFVNSTKPLPASELHLHVDSCHDGNVKSIFECNENDDNDSDLEITDEIIPLKKSIDCGKCSKTFTRLEDYHEHVSQSHPEMQFLCNSCRQLFRSLAEMRRHRNEMHPDELCIRCDRCQVFTATDAVQLEKHKRESCRVECVHRCFLCGFITQDEAAYKTHLSSEAHKRAMTRRKVNKYIKAAQNQIKKKGTKPDITVDKYTGQIFVGGQPLSFTKVPSTNGKRKTCRTR